MFALGVAALVSLWGYWKALNMTISGAPVIIVTTKHVEERNVGKIIAGLLLMLLTGAILVTALNAIELLNINIAIAILIIIALIRWIYAYVRFIISSRLGKTRKRTPDPLKTIYSNKAFPSGAMDPWV